MPVKIGELLLEENIVTPQQLLEALELQKANGGKVGRALVSLGFVKEEQIVELLSRQYGLARVDLDHFEVDPAIIRIIPAETARKYQVLPLSRSGVSLTIAMADPANKSAMEEITFMTGYNVEPMVASETALEESMDYYYGSSARFLRLQRGAGGGDHLKEMTEGPALTMDDMAGIGGLAEIDFDAMSDAEVDAGSVIKLVNVLLVDSLKRRASDIHIEPYETEFRARYRIDGLLYNVLAMPMTLKDPLTSRIKTMARLDITEKRLPQDGRIKIKMRVENRTLDLDFLVSCLPTLWGEKIVMRLLDKSQLMLDVTKLGFEPHSLERFKNAICKPYGIVLVTGPTGSGKTNTLYSAIAALNKPETNIMTAEDPVEFNLAGINQVQVRRDIGLDHAAALRVFSRQDANIILVHPIRDYDPIETAIKTSKNCVLLADMYEPDTASAIEFLLEALARSRLRPSTLARVLRLVVAQRLVRRICEECRVEHDVPSKTLIDIGFAPEETGEIRLFRGKGCGTCNGTGYKGRIGLFEVMETGEGIRDLIRAGASAAEIRKKAVEEGMITLQQSGLEKLKTGITTVDEVIRETVY